MNNEEIPASCIVFHPGWSEGLLRDEDFVSGMQYLISNGILKI